MEKNGFLWDNLEELENKTMEVINNEKLQKDMSKESIQKAKTFSIDNFQLKVKELV